MSSSISRILYKNLLRTAREFDQHPWTRALVVTATSLRPTVGTLEFYLNRTQHERAPAPLYPQSDLKSPSCVELVRREFRDTSKPLTPAALTAALASLKSLTLVSWPASLRLRDTDSDEMDVSNAFNSMIFSVDDVNERDERDEAVVEDEKAEDEDSEDDADNDDDTDDTELLSVAALPGNVRELARELDRLSVEDIEEAMALFTLGSDPSVGNNPKPLLDLSSLLKQLKDQRAGRDDTEQVDEDDDADQEDMHAEALAAAVAEEVEDEDLAQSLSYQREIDHVTLRHEARDQPHDYLQSVFPFTDADLSLMEQHAREIERVLGLLPPYEDVVSLSPESLLAVSDAMEFFLPAFANASQSSLPPDTEARAHYSHRLTNLHYHLLLDHCIRQGISRGVTVVFATMNEHGHRLTRSMCARLLQRCRDYGRPIEAMFVLRETNYGNIPQLQLTGTHTHTETQSKKFTRQQLFPSCGSSQPAPFIDTARAASLHATDRDRLVRDGVFVELVIQASDDDDYTEDVIESLEDTDNTKLPLQPLVPSDSGGGRGGDSQHHVGIDHFHLMQVYDIPITRLSTLRSLFSIADALQHTSLAIDALVKTVNDGVAVSTSALEQFLQHACNSFHTDAALDAINAASTLDIPVTADTYAILLLYATSAPNLAITNSMIERWSARVGLTIESDQHYDPNHLLVTALLVHAESRGVNGCDAVDACQRLVGKEVLRAMKSELRDIRDWISEKFDLQLDADSHDDEDTGDGDE